MKGKDNEIQYISLQQTNFINYLANANEEITNLRLENERLQNDLNTKKKINERMMKSQVDMDQLNEKNHHRQKGKAGIGYIKEGESSKLAITVVRQVLHQKNVGAMGKKNSMENSTITINMVIRLMNARRNQSLKGNVTTVKNMNTSHQNAKPRY